MAIQNTFYLDVDIKRDNYVDEPKVTQNDAVTFVLRMTDDGIDYPLTGVSTYTLASLRPDGQSVLTVGTKTADNEITFELGSTEVSVPGNVKAAIQLYDVDGRVSSIPFTYEVTKDIATGYIPSEDEQTLIELVLGEGPAILSAAEAATITANDAAVNADDKAALANAEAQSANSAAIYARDNGLLAEQKAALADASAVSADTATYNAENATQEAQDATDAIHAVLPNVEGLENKGEYNNATTYVKNNLVERNGSSWQALQDTVGNPPPTLPAKSNAYWVLVAQRGVDGMGSVVSVNGEGPDVNGNVSITIPDPDLSGLATKQDLQTLDDGVTQQLVDMAVNVKSPLINGLTGAKGDYSESSGTGTDDTEAIQSIIDYVSSKGGGTVLIPDSSYRVSADANGVVIDVKDNITMVFGKKAKLHLAANSLWAYQMLRIYNKKNVTIYGGELIGDLDNHVVTGGEWGNGIEIKSSENVKIVGTKATKMWGDGFFIGSSQTEGIPKKWFSEDITMIDIIGDGNRRQGLSLTSCKNFNLIRPKFSNTLGTAPQAGMDIEPDHAEEFLENIYIEKMVTENNGGSGLLVYLSALSQNNNTVSIHVLNHHDEGSLHGLMVTGYVPNLKGLIKIDNPSYKNNQNSGIYIQEPAASGARIEIHNPEIVNPNRSNGTSVDHLGGIIVAQSNGQPSDRLLGNTHVYYPSIINEGVANNSRGILIDGNGAKIKNISVIDPVRLSSKDGINMIKGKASKASDSYELLVYSPTTTHTITTANYFSKYTNENAAGQLIFNLSLDEESDIDIKFEVLKDATLIIKPVDGMAIKPITEIPNQYILCGTSGSSITLRRKANYYAIINQVGVWTV